MAEKRRDTFTCQRISFTTTQSFDSTSARLQKLIAPFGPVLPEELAQAKSRDRSSFEAFISSRTGPHGIVQLGEINHGAWIKLFDVGDGLRLKRIILGNPLVAITMLKHDLGAGLFVPVELLLRELPQEMGTEILYVVPSSLITATNKGQELSEAAQVIDKKVEDLVQELAAPKAHM